MAIHYLACDLGAESGRVMLGTLDAGKISLEELQEALKPNRQWMPIRPFLGKTTTLGSVLALGACGPERLRYGAPRDLLLGLRFVSGTGRLMSTGGKVVKNVAGYDLGRLLAGSAGTLGFLTELTLRVSALPESCREARSCGSLEKIASAAGELLRSNIEPAFVVASPLNGATSGAGTETEQANWTAERHNHFRVDVFVTVFRIVIDAHRRFIGAGVERVDVAFVFLEHPGDAVVIGRHLAVRRDKLGLDCLQDHIVGGG